MYNFFNIYPDVYTSQYSQLCTKSGCLNSKISISFRKLNMTAYPEPNSTATLTDCFIAGRSCQM